MAIASAVLSHLVTNVRCSTLFITHYPLVASSLAERYPNLVQNLHMGYSEDTRIDGTRQVTFLYKLEDGLAEESFGVECARLAGLDERILRRAAEMGRKMEAIVEARRKRNRCDLLVAPRVSPAEPLNRTIKALQQLIRVTAGADNSLSLTHALTELRSITDSIATS